MQVVHYDPSKPTFIEKGKPATVYPLDHPSPLVSNTAITHTTYVKDYDSESGIFVTENTTYVPKQV